MSYTTRPGWAITGTPPEGVVPVQATGTIAGGDDLRHWYFRARYDRWTLAIGPLDADIPGYVSEEDADLTVWGRYGTEYDAGYMPDDAAVSCIQQGLDLYMDGKRGSKQLKRIEL